MARHIPHKKDLRVSIKVQKATRDRIMAMRYTLGVKSVDEALNKIADAASQVIQEDF